MAASSWDCSSSSGSCFEPSSRLLQRYSPVRAPLEAVPRCGECERRSDTADGRRTRPLLQTRYRASIRTPCVSVRAATPCGSIAWSWPLGAAVRRLRELHRSSATSERTCGPPARTGAYGGQVALSTYLSTCPLLNCFHFKSQRPSQYDTLNSTTSSPGAPNSARASRPGTKWPGLRKSCCWRVHTT
jgi:hypothetical protein